MGVYCIRVDRACAAARKIGGCRSHGSGFEPVGCIWWYSVIICLIGAVTFMVILHAVRRW